jgi:hypothetical protein
MERRDELLFFALEVLSSGDAGVTPKMNFEGTTQTEGIK